MPSENLTFRGNDRKLLQNICSLTQKRVLNVMDQVLHKYYTDIEVNRSFILAKGDIPVALVAHADTVFKTPPRTFYFDEEKSTMWSPDGLGADDRAGIFSIIKVLMESPLRPHIVITTDEECGCIGAGKLIAKYPKFPAPLKFLIQLDRRGKHDSVYYDCENEDFEKFITEHGFVTAYGTLSDISLLAPAWKVAAVNLSIGYQNEHSVSETLHIGHMYDTIDKVKKILEDAKSDEVPMYEYMESPNTWRSFLTENGKAVSKHYDYAYNPRWLGDCEICNCTAEPTELLTITWASTMEEVEVCIPCFSRFSDKVTWCKECGEGWIDSDYRGEMADYVCPLCKRKKEKTYAL